MKSLLLLTLIAVASLQVASIARASDGDAPVVHRFGADSGPSTRTPQAMGHARDDESVVTTSDGEMSVDPLSHSHGPNGRMDRTR